MGIDNELSYDLCRILLRRAAWRLQYKVRTQHNREGFSIFDYQSHDNSFDEKILSEIYVKELLDMIPWEQSKIVIKEVIIEKKTEKEVALKLQISQQAVNKWKMKGLKLLRQNLKNSQI